MNKILSVIIMSMFVISSYSQSKKFQACDSVLELVNMHLSNIEYRTNSINRYKLYPTENIYNFLKLDTSTGIIRQVQWSLEEENEGSVYINSDDLSYNTELCGRFELYPTKNIYQFILLDTLTGRQWHVQWGLEGTNRWIRRIW